MSRLHAGVDGRWGKAVNFVNPLGTKGNLARAFANIVKEMWQGEITTISPITFRVSPSFVFMMLLFVLIASGTPSSF